MFIEILFFLFKCNKFILISFVYVYYFNIFDESDFFVNFEN